MDDFKFYEVGGKIRDELLGLTNKDVDYVAVPTEAVYSKIHPCEAQLSPAQLMFKALKSYLEEQKFEIFLVTTECYTIRAKFPEGYKYQGVADFVMARKDVEAQLEELNTLGRARWELMKQYGEDSVQAKIYDDKIADASLNIKKIGHFCADTGMVAVFLLDEVLKYNPDFDYHINREWTTTLIKDFDGEVNYYVDSEDDACIIGVGNINFFTS